MTPIYHITHIDNLWSIVAAGRLWSDAQRTHQGLLNTNIGYSHIKGRRMRRQVPVAARGVLGDYVPFNFCHRSVMLYVIHRGHADYAGGQMPIVHLVSSVEAVIASGRPWAFTDRHADLAYANYYDNLTELTQLDWQVMPLVQWGGDDERKERRQAEFLVHDWLPWEAIERIGVHNDEMAVRAKTAITSASHRPAVQIELGWYY